MPNIKVTVYEDKHLIGSLYQRKKSETFTAHLTDDELTELKAKQE